MDHVECEQAHVPAERQAAACVRLAMAAILVDRLFLAFHQQGGNLLLDVGFWWSPPQTAPEWHHICNAGCFAFYWLEPILEIALIVVALARPRGVGVWLLAVLLGRLLLVTSDELQMRIWLPYQSEEIQPAEPLRWYELAGDWTFAARVLVLPAALMSWYAMIGRRWRPQFAESGGVRWDMATPMWDGAARAVLAAVVAWIALDERLAPSRLWGHIKLLGEPEDGGISWVVQDACTVGFCVLASALVVSRRMVRRRVGLLLCVALVASLVVYGLAVTRDLRVYLSAGAWSAIWRDTLCQTALVRGLHIPATLALLSLFLATGDRARYRRLRAKCVCRRCGYVLIGGASERCPECGTPVRDPAGRRRRTEGTA